MRILKPFALIILLFVSCSKEKSSTQLQSSSADNSSAILDTAKIPIIDLKNGTYRGNRGGLYPEGRNIPTGIYATDLLKASRNTLPIDTFGNPAIYGRVVFISLGGSTCGHNMIQLKKQTVGNPKTNPRLNLLNCANGYGSDH
jgi:hypothetical protein